MINRPTTEEEKQNGEAIGVIRASRLVRKLAHCHEEINMETVSKIHAEIFKNVWPEIAGKYRQENLKITDSKHLPPHWSKVPSLMKEKDEKLKNKLGKLKKIEGIAFKGKKNPQIVLREINKIVKVSSWIHHSITFIHPFREGNGRTARLAANLILERFGLIGISIKIEKENKNKYRAALAQADSRYDYRPLENLIFKGIKDRYEGVVIKFYDYGKKKL